MQSFMLATGTVLWYSVSQILVHHSSFSSTGMAWQLMNNRNLVYRPTCLHWPSLVQTLHVFVAFFSTKCGINVKNVECLIWNSQNNAAKVIHATIYSFAWEIMKKCLVGSSCDLVVVQVSYVSIHCAELYTPRLIFEHILSQLSGEQSEKCDDINTFIRLLKSVKQKISSDNEPLYLVSGLTSRDVHLFRWLLLNRWFINEIQKQ